MGNRPGDNMGNRPGDTLVTAQLTSVARSGDIGLFWRFKEPQNPSGYGNRQTLVLQPEWLPIKLKPLR
jgi:hypothetical protein